MALADMLTKVADEYIYEQGKRFEGSPFADFVRKDLVEEVKRQLIFTEYDLKVKASVGAGNWASVPWLAFFDPLITESATKGFYVVYLFNPDTGSITLSMNQGTTAVYAEYGRPRGDQVLRRRARDISARLADLKHRFDEAPIDLGSTASLPKGYEFGHAFGATYQKGKLSQEQCLEDLFEMLELYSKLVERGGTTPTDVMFEQSGTTDVEETRKFILSRRIERSPKVRRAVLEKRPPVCQACGLEPSKDYGFSGAAKEVPLDVHHAKPLWELAEGETRRYCVPDDFLVLCPTCHRMIHKQSNPSDLQQLKSRIRFKHARLVE
nr:DUF3578 domain-containing protein [uncultured Celeribacter sp.]